MDFYWMNLSMPVRGVSSFATPACKVLLLNLGDWRARIIPLTRFRYKITSQLVVVKYETHSSGGV